jgi:hypothetical protein
VQRPHKSVAFPEEQNAILPLQQHEASIRLNDEALAEWFEVQNNRANEAGITWIGGDEAHDGKHKSNTPEAERKQNLCHRRPPRKVGENAQIDVAIT